MPYGIMQESTRELITRRAAQSGIPIERLGLDPDFDKWYDDKGEPKGGTFAEIGALFPDNLYEISVIFGGALDESFYVETDYEVNIADWIAEQCREESDKQGGEQWEIIVSSYMHDDCGPVRYRVTDESSV